MDEQMAEADAQQVLSAHTDESGNTGQNLFDPAQPIFWTGTLLASSNLDIGAAGRVAEIAKPLGIQELHGAALGLNGVEKVAGDIRELLSTFDCKLVFTRIEK